MAGCTKQCSHKSCGSRCSYVFQWKTQAGKPKNNVRTPPQTTSPRISSGKASQPAGRPAKSMAHAAQARKAFAARTKHEHLCAACLEGNCSGHSRVQLPTPPYTEEEDEALSESSDLDDKKDSSSVLVSPEQQKQVDFMSSQEEEDSSDSASSTCDESDDVAFVEDSPTIRPPLTDSCCEECVEEKMRSARLVEACTSANVEVAGLRDFVSGQASLINKLEEQIKSTIADCNAKVTAMRENGEESERERRKREAEYRSAEEELTRAILSDFGLDPNRTEFRTDEKARSDAIRELQARQRPVPVPVGKVIFLEAGKYTTGWKYTVAQCDVQTQTTTVGGTASVSFFFVSFSHATPQSTSSATSSTTGLLEFTVEEVIVEDTKVQVGVCMNVNVSLSPEQLQKIQKNNIFYDSGSFYFVDPVHVPGIADRCLVSFPRVPTVGDDVKVAWCPHKFETQTEWHFRSDLNAQHGCEVSMSHCVCGAWIPWHHMHGEEGPLARPAVVVGLSI